MVCRYAARVKGGFEVDNDVSNLVGLCEQIETQLAEGKPVDIAATATLINVFNRTASLLGLKRRARDVTPHLEDYISQRYSADEGGL